MVASRTSSPVVIDGRADDAIWSSAETRDDFVERTPNLGATPPIKVSFQVAFDDLNLYVLIRHEGLDRPVRVRSLRRDSWGVFSGDWTSVKIDPLHDRRTSYSFITNPDGVQVDVLGLDDGRIRLRQWDSVWRAETQVFEGGWQAEIAIPLYVLGLRPGKDQVMGFNVTVGDPARAADIDWSLIPPQLGGLSSSAHGDLKGLNNLTTSKALEVTPFVSARSDFSRKFTMDPRRQANVSAGGDMRLQTSPGGYVEATLLTDFAQVEADEVQVARDRFPLFFPERRPFFLNGLDVVNFGRERDAQLFFSRRIGLDAGQPVAIASGLKAYGRSETVSYALLNVQTLRRFKNPEIEGDTGTPAENITVARVRAQVTPKVAIGGLAMGKTTTANNDASHIAAGLDAEIRLLQSKLRLYGFGAATSNRSSLSVEEPSTEFETPARDFETTTGASGYFTVDYRGLYVRPRVSWLWSDGDFDPKLGFYRRLGTARQDAEIRFVPRPTVLGLQEISFGPNVSLTTDPSYDKILTRDLGGSLKFRWAGGGEASYRIAQYVDTVADPFELYGYEVSPNTYFGIRHALKAETPRRFRVSGNTSVEFFDLFAGRAVQLRGQLLAQPIRFFSIGATYTHLLGNLGDNQDFDFGYLNGVVEVNFSRSIFFDSVIRMSLEPGNERVGTQNRLRWRYRPGSDFFLVYRNDIPLATNSTAPFHELILKVSFYARALFDRRAKKRERSTSLSAAEASMAWEESPTTKLSNDAPDALKLGGDLRTR